MIRLVDIPTLFLFALLAMVLGWLSDTLGIAGRIDALPDWLQLALLPIYLISLGVASFWIWHKVLGETKGRRRW